MEHLLCDGPASDPTGAAAAALMVKYAAPESVRAAPDVDLVNHAPLAVNFADRGRTYPVHTAKAAWASAAFYHAGGSTDSAVADRIKKACETHRLFGEWEKLAASARPAPPDAPTRYALPAVRKYPVDTADQVKAAAAYFALYADRLEAADRREFAANVVKAAAAHPGALGTDAANRLELEAGLGRLADGWKRAFDDRARLAAAENLPELAEAIKEASSAPPPDTAVAAAMLREVDRRNNWKLDDPLAVLADETPTTARMKFASLAKAADGSWYSREDLAAVPDDAVSSLFGAPVVVSDSYKAALLADPTKCASFRVVLADHGVHAVEEAPRPRVDWAALAGGSGK